MLLHTEYAEVTDVGANTFIPSEAAPHTGPPFFTRRFEAQLHWQPVVQVRRRIEGGEAPRRQGGTTENIGNHSCPN